MSEDWHDGDLDRREWFVTHPEEEDTGDERELKQGQMDGASEEDFDKWARAYDELDGAPENDDDR